MFKLKHWWSIVDIVFEDNQVHWIYRVDQVHQKDCVDQVDPADQIDQIQNIWSVFLHFRDVYVFFLYRNHSVGMYVGR